MAEAYPDDYTETGFSNEADVSNGKTGHTSNPRSKNQSKQASLSDVTLRLEPEVNTVFDEQFEEKLQSPLKAKIVASVVMVMCGFAMGFAAYREAVLASKISDPWMRGLRIRNSYVISAAGVFLGLFMWSLIIWLLDTYFNT